jgi:hypothetical protein
MVSWNASGGRAEGKVLRIERSGKINVPDSSFELKAQKMTLRLIDYFVS